MTKSTTSLAQRIEQDGFGALFYWPQHDRTIEQIWAEPGNPAALEAVVADPAAPGKARFIAAEVLFRKDFSFLGRVDNRVVAAVYAEALQRRYTPNANAWGLLWINDSVGAGGRFEILEGDAVPALTALLDDDTVVDWYEGSEEATLGNGARYRIKDFAAFYLARIAGVTLPFHRDPAARDAEIAGLREALARRTL